MTNEEIESEKLKFLMNVFDKMQDLKLSNPADPNLPEIERLFIKHSKDLFAYKRTITSDMYTHSIENIISRQSKEFYESKLKFLAIKDEAIKKQLIDDYLQMEIQRRRDNFERFCQCIYQQIEAVITYIYSNEIAYKSVVANRKKAPYGSSRFDKTQNKVVYNKFIFPIDKTTLKPTITVQSLIFGFAKRANDYYTDSDYDLYFNDVTKTYKSIDKFITKFKICIFVHYFNEAPASDEFKEMADTMNEISIMRNTFHRGPETFYKNQIDIKDSISKDTPFYTYKFLNFLNSLMDSLLK